MLQTVEHETGRPVHGSVVWLHGLGADGHDFEPIVPELALDGRPLRFVFPHAPAMPVTLNGGMVMRAWFDIYDLDRDARQDEAGIRRSQCETDELVRREIERGVPARRIVLAGFSQGGAIALHAGLRFPEALAGILALSTYLPLGSTLAAEAHEANARTPVFLGHGTDDPLVPESFGTATRDALAARGIPVTWRSYRMPHAVCAEEIRDIRGWLDERLPPEP